MPRSFTVAIRKIRVFNARRANIKGKIELNYVVIIFTLVNIAKARANHLLMQTVVMKGTGTV